MEQRYKLALEIILNFCSKEGNYISCEKVKTICQTALNEEDGEEDASHT